MARKNNSVSTDTNGRSERRRVLGDEWKSWDGKIASNINKYQYTRYIFLGFFILSCAVVFFLVNFTYYMISPRLALLFSSQERIFSLLLISLDIMLLLVFISITVIIIFKMRFISPRLKNVFLLKSLFSLSVRIALLFNISKDNIYNAFIQFSNTLTGAFSRRSLPEKILVLIPRCIEKEQKKEITDICTSYHVHYAFADGGETARKRIFELKPKNVIGIACERDLYSGIVDMNSTVDVFGICNIRPEGPCINTHIDIQDLITMLDKNISKSAGA